METTLEIKVAYKFNLIVDNDCFDQPLKLPYKTRGEAIQAYHTMSAVLTKCQYTVEDYCYYLDDCNTMKYTTLEKMK